MEFIESINHLLSALDLSALDSGLSDTGKRIVGEPFLLRER